MLELVSIEQNLDELDKLLFGWLYYSRLSHIGWSAPASTKNLSDVYQLQTFRVTARHTTFDEASILTMVITVQH